MPAGPGRADHGRGGGDAGNPVHRLEQSVRARLCARRRDGARPWRHQRHRHHGDRLVQPVRPAHHRHLRQRGKVPPCRGAGRRPCHRLSGERFRRGSEADHRGARRRDRARHGRRRLSAAQSLLPGRGRPPCLDRRPARRHRRAQHRRDDDAAPDPDRIDAAAALRSRSSRWSPTRSSARSGRSWRRES